MRRPNPGLRPQHLQVVEAIRQLVDGITEGVQKGTQEFVFAPGFQQKASHYAWNIGSAGSATMLALAVLPVLVFRSSPVDVTIQGDTFQDFAPSVFHLFFSGIRGLGTGNPRRGALPRHAQPAKGQPKGCVADPPRRAPLGDTALGGQRQGPPAGGRAERPWPLGPQGPAGVAGPSVADG
jgi:hypothetical protein